MFKPAVIFVILCIFLFAIGSVPMSGNRVKGSQETRIVTASATTFPVVRVPYDYPNIQEAIDAAAPGSTVLVGGGFYVEHLVINKTLTLLGEDKTTTILDGNHTGTIISVMADNVVINGFTIQNSSYGIVLSQSHNSTVDGNFITLNRAGVSLENSTETTVSDNTITKCGITGIPSIGGAIGLGYSNNNSIHNNLVVEGYEGLWVGGSDYNLVYGNTFANLQSGLHLFDSNYNFVFRNTLSSNYNAISLAYSDNNRIHHNNLVNSTELSIQYSTNFFNDGVEGNYWDSYNGLDDGSNWRTMGDGVGDTNLPHLGVDWYPLISPRDAIPVIVEYVAYPVSLAGNSTVSAFSFNQGEKKIAFSVNGPNATAGYCNVTIPKNLLHGPWTVLVDNIDVTSQSQIMENETQTFVDMTYAHSAHTIQIIGRWVVPEFPSVATVTVALLLNTISILLASRFRKKERRSEGCAP